MKQRILKNQYIQNFYNILMTPAIRVLPGSLAFFLVMSIVPTITLASVLCAKFSLTTIDIADLFGNFLPNGVEELLESIFVGVNSNTGLWSIILGLILASNGAHAIILASNMLYDIPNKNFLARRIKSFFLTFVLMFLFFFILLVLAFGNIIVSFITSLKIFAPMASKIYSAFIILKWPLAVIIVSLVIKVLYTIAPDKTVPSKYVNKGTIFATIGLIISTAFYSYYANNIADYSYMYGNLATIIVLMILIYVCSYILVIGIAINANEYKFIEKEKTTK